jgi:hypothetical protein
VPESAKHGFKEKKTIIHGEVEVQVQMASVLKKRHKIPFHR